MCTAFVYGAKKPRESTTAVTRDREVVSVGVCACASRSRQVHVWVLLLDVNVEPAVLVIRVQVGKVVAAVACETQATREPAMIAADVVVITRRIVRGRHGRLAQALAKLQDGLLQLVLTARAGLEDGLEVADVLDRLLQDDTFVRASGTTS